MSEKTIEERLSELKQKRDHVGDPFGAADVHTIVDGILYAMSHGGEVSVAVTPIAGGGGYKITVTTADGTQEATVKDGGDAYEVYKSTVPEGQTPMNKTEWLASLKGDAAVNPFKGYYPSGVSKPATGAVGDYLYASPSDPESSATATMWYYDNTQTPPWTDTEIDVSDAVAVEFGSGQSVPATKIMDENGEEVTGNVGVLSAEAGLQIGVKLRGVTASEVKVTQQPVTGSYIKGTDGTIKSESNTAYIEVAIGNNKNVRFLGAWYTASYAGGYAFGHYTDESDPTTWVTDKSAVFDTDASILGTKKYVIAVPEGATHFRTTTAIGAIPALAQNFYCYLQSGESAGESIDKLKTDFDKLNLDVNGGETLDYVDTELEYTVITDRGINRSNEWNIIPSTISQFTQFQEATKIKLENIGELDFIYTILSSVSGYETNGTNAQFVQGWSKKVLAKNSYVEIDIPASYYLYLVKQTSEGTNQAKTSVLQTVIKEGLADKVPNVIDNLESSSSTDALSAGQGKELKNMVNDLATDIFGGDKNVQVVGSLNLSVGKTGTRAYFPNGYQYGTSPYIQKSYYYQVDVFESYDNTYLRVYAGQHNCYVTLLQTTSGLDAEGTPSYASVMVGSPYIKVDPNSFADIVLSSDCKYLVFYNKDNTGAGAVDGYYMPSKVEYITKEVVDPIISTSKISITHLVPDNEGQLNAVRRMRKLTDIKWTPSFDFGRMSGGFGKSFGDTFLEGVEIAGIPYSRAYINNGTYGSYDYGYPGDTGFKIGFRISLETFVTSVYNRGTVIEKESNYNSSLHCSSFYANICAGAVSAALGKDYLMTNNFDNGLDTGAPTGFTNIGRISDDFDLKLLKLGDAIAKKDVHTAMITDVIKNNAGEIEYIEVGESNCVGGNPNIVGAKLGGTTRRVWWNLSEFHRVWNGYKVLRSTNIESLTYTPSPYCPMPDENYIYAQYYMACLPYMGNKFRYVYDKMPDRMRKLVVQAKDRSKLHILKENNGVYEDFLITDVPAFSTGTGEGEGYDYVYIVLPDYNDPSTPMTTGNYKAYLCNISNGSEIDKTGLCEWSVVDTITKLVDY